MSGVQAVNISGQANAVEATDVSLRLTVATTADETTSLYVFLGGTAIDQLNNQLKTMSETIYIYPLTNAPHNPAYCYV